MENHPHKKRITVGRVVLGVLLVVMVVSISSLGYLYYQTRQELMFLASPQGQEELARREVDQLVAALDRLIVLPEGDPVVATITDAPMLASESAFYRNAENGDKLLVYPESQQAFIYSPHRNKIVNVGPLLIEDAPVGENANGTTEALNAATATFEIRNGSSAAGLATQVSQEISANISGAEILSVNEAARNDYESAVLVDLSGGQFPELVQAVATQYNASIVSALPEGESQTTADILLIVAE